MFFILSSGADPIQTLESIAKKSGVHDKIFRVAMGQGQDVVAMNRLEDGHRMVLKNYIFT